MNLICNKVVKKLIKKKITISTAESCTGGLLASSLTSIQGSSSIFNLGLVTYSNKSKVNILKIPKDVIKKYETGTIIPNEHIINKLRRVLQMV